MAGGQIRKHSVSIRGHRTSITLEDAFMDALRQMADQRGMAVAALIAEIDAAQAAPGTTPANLSSAIRVAVLEWALNGGGDKAPDSAPSPDP
jgi:predicted DNA-binding ribbon-helix-helix protein